MKWPWSKKEAEEVTEINYWERDTSKICKDCKHFRIKILGSDEIHYCYRRALEETNLICGTKYFIDTPTCEWERSGGLGRLTNVCCPIGQFWEAKE